MMGDSTQYLMLLLFSMDRICPGSNVVLSQHLEALGWSNAPQLCAQPGLGPVALHRDGHVCRSRHARSPRRASGPSDSLPQPAWGPEAAASRLGSLWAERGVWTLAESLGGGGQGYGTPNDGRDGAGSRGWTGHSGDVLGTSEGVCWPHWSQAPQEPPLGRQGLGSLQQNSVMDNCELKVIEIPVGTEQLKLLNKPAMIQYVQPGRYRTVYKLFLTGRLI